MSDTNTIIGESILIKGNLEGDEDLTIQGRVEGSINLTRTLIVEPGGVVKAEVSVANAIVSGIMVGNITGTDSVELTESGRMVGDIQAPRVIINEGALFKGQVDMGDLEMPRQSSSSKPSYQPAPMRSEPVSRPAPIPASKPEPKPVPKPIPRPVVKPVQRKPVTVAAGGKKKKVVVKKKRR
jgi:cytoskeletal protein CcmA (bactofilin family)